MSKLDIVFEDDYLVVVNKEAGMLTVADRFNTSSLHLQALLRKKYTDIFTVHRLDRDTSGLLIFAKDEETHRRLSVAFESREVGKFYLAIVTGTCDEEGFIDLPIAHSTTKLGTMVIHKRGKESQTKYRRLETYTNSSLVEVELLTGRTHQIRVHFAAIGHPLFVDPVYGKRESFFLSELKGKKFKLAKNQEEERPLIDRQTLHSHRLELIHPYTGEALKLVAKLPKDMKAFIKQVGKLTT